ncbi:MAG: hypothetical protein ACRCVU_19640 [Flavobacterium sp.]|uniref:Uncharacterized protein n=1 Tax=Myroides marinus TaxID=703342 RepID=A0A163WCP6_9FLAO|nr:hypothetical protein [Myroides marinus]KZE76168.1 hypothetical protein AV926_16105 [Myroides marinus]
MVIKIKHIILSTSSIILLFLLHACSPVLNKKVQNNSILIQGRVTLVGTDSVPLGITSVNIKNKWVWKDDNLQAYGENKRVFVDKKGYYQIHIQKNDTLVFVPNHILYGGNIDQYTYSNLKESQTLNVQIKKDQKTYEALTKNNPVLKANLEKHLKDTDTETLVTVSGTIVSKETHKPLKNVDVGSAFNNSTFGTGTYHLTDEKGEFKLQLHKGSLFSVLSLSPNSIGFYPQRDTIVNLYL